MAVESTRFLHGSWQSSAVYSLVQASYGKGLVIFTSIIRLVFQRQWRIQVSMSSLETSYSWDDLENPGIRGNEENLTFPRLSSEAENGNRLLKISKSWSAERAGFSRWAKLWL